MAFERRQPLTQGTLLKLKKEDSSELGLIIERVICYGENCIAYVGRICGTEETFAKKVVLKEFYPVSEADFVVRGDSVSGFLILSEGKEKDFISKGHALFEGAFPFTGVAEGNHTVYTYTNVNDVITLREWMEAAGQLAKKDIAQMMSLVCGQIQQVHDRGELYLNCSPDSIYLIRGEDPIPDEVYLFDLDAVKSKYNADLQFQPYMQGWAPLEQLRGEKRYIDVQADIYAVGAVFLWMLTGKTIILDLDKEPVKGFLWDDFSSLIVGENPDTNNRLVREILEGALHAAWNARYMNISVLKKAFDKLVKKYVREEKGNRNTDAEPAAYKDAANLTDSLESETEKNLNGEKDCIANTHMENNERCYAEVVNIADYLNGGHSEKEVAAGKPEKEGKFTFTNGNVYEGDWAAGRPEGKGKLTFVNGDVYEGDWVAGRPEGKGKFTYADGNMYDGFWHEGKRNGNGTILLAEGVLLRGIFSDGEPVGKVYIKYQDGFEYTGAWSNGSINGEGEFSLSGGPFEKFTIKGYRKNGKFWGGDCVLFLWTTKKTIFEYQGVVSNFMLSGYGTLYVYDNLIKEPIDSGQWIMGKKKEPSSRMVKEAESQFGNALEYFRKRSTDFEEAVQKCQKALVQKKIETEEDRTEDLESYLDSLSDEEFADYLSEFVKSLTK